MRLLYSEFSILPNEFQIPRKCCWWKLQNRDCLGIIYSATVVCWHQWCSPPFNISASSKVLKSNSNFGAESCTASFQMAIQQSHIHRKSQCKMVFPFRVGISAILVRDSSHFDMDCNCGLTDKLVSGLL